MTLGISTRRYLGCSGSSPLPRGSAAAPPAPEAHKPQGWVCARPGISASLDLTGARSLPPGPSFAAPPCPAGVVREGRPRRGVWGKNQGTAGLARGQAASGAQRHRAASQGRLSAGAEQGNLLGAGEESMLQLPRSVPAPAPPGQPAAPSQPSAMALSVGQDWWGLCFSLSEPRLSAGTINEEGTTSTDSSPVGASELRSSCFFPGVPAAPECCRHHRHISGRSSRRGDSLSSVTASWQRCCLKQGAWFKGKDIITSLVKGHLSPSKGLRRRHHRTVIPGNGEKTQKHFER